MLGNPQMGFLALLLLLIVSPSDSTIQKLNSIKDLKRIPFGQSVPQHSLALLHWFANNIELNNNDAIELTFDPDQGDYGTHHYGNYERLLDPLPRGQGSYRYFTLGNLHHMNNGRTVERLPSYFTGRLNNLMPQEELNRARIVFRLRNQDTLDLVYLTQHYEANQQHGTMYDPLHTYRITANLLRELREFSLDRSHLSHLAEIRDHFGSGIGDQELQSLRNQWGELACLGLLLFIVISEKNLPLRPNRPLAPAPAPAPYRPPRQNLPAKQNLPRKQTDGRSASRHTVVNIPDHRPSRSLFRHQVIDVEQGAGSVTLGVRAGTKGKATVFWEGIPQRTLQEGVLLVLYKNDGDTSRILRTSPGKTWGTFETSVPLNKGLQVRLHKARRYCLCFTTVGEELSRGPEYHNAPAESLVSIQGSDAKLNVFVKDGTACARLYIPETFTNWRSDFRRSWVGFYTSDCKQTNQYETWQWQWATKFVEQDTLNVYTVYEYQSSVAVSLGVHARFIDRHGKERARTPAWT